MSPADLLWAELDKYAKTLEPRLRQAFLDAVLKLRAQVTEAELLEAVTRGDPSALLRRLDLGPFQHTLRNAVVEVAGQSLPGIPMTVHLDLFNTMVQRAMMASELNLLTGLTVEVREGARQALVAGLQQGVNPVDTARVLRNSLGLGPKDVQAVANYRKLLTGGAKGQPYTESIRRGTRDARFDRSVQRAIRARVPLEPEQVDRLVARFQERLLKRKAETVARTESISALWQGQHLRWRQAIENGLVQESELRRYWHVAKDERVCTVCKPIPELNPEGVAFEQPFQLGNGVTLMGPAAHPNCRCVVFVKPIL